MRGIVTAVAAVMMISVGVWGCGNADATGGGYPTSPSAPPSAPSAPSASGVVTINVIAINGAQSFSPNPATVPAGQMVVWHNIDNVTHHVVLNDGSVDTGNLAPGASSQPMALGGAGGGPYHCTIHPEMVGTINQVSASPASPPPCEGQYCN